MSGTGDLPARPPDLDLDDETRRALTEQAVRFVLEHVRTLGEQPAGDLEGARELAAELARDTLPEAPRPFDELLETVQRATRKSFNTAGPGYLAYVPGGGLYPAALADYIALASNRYIGVWSAAPALVQLEENALQWLRELVGLPTGWSGVFTSGGSLSNLIAVITARRTRMPRDFSRCVVYVSRDCHHCVTKACVLAGFPPENVTQIAIDERRRLLPEDLAQRIAADRRRGLRPAMVVASAGTTNTGALDPLPAMAEICRREDLWLHTDAAYGGLFRMLPDGSALIPGLELSDSVTLDPHKGLFLPYGTGCLLVRRRADLLAAHRVGADYLQDLELPADAPHYADLSPELSRDFRGLRVWMCLALYGAEALRANLAEKLALAQWAYEALRTIPGIRIWDAPQLSVVAFQYAPQGRDPAQLNELNRRLLAGILAGQRVFISSTQLDGSFVLRFCVLSFRTHAEHVSIAVDEVRRAITELRHDSPTSR